MRVDHPGEGVPLLLLECKKAQPPELGDVVVHVSPHLTDQRGVGMGKELTYGSM